MAQDIQRPDEHEDLFGAHLPAPEAKSVSEKPAVCTLSILKLLDKTSKLLQKSSDTMDCVMISSLLMVRRAL